MAAALSNKMAMRPVSRTSVARKSVVAKAALDPSIVISGSTAAMLFIGRTVFLPYQRKEVASSGSVGPKTTGTTFFDSLQKDASFLQTTGDPEKFTLIDVFGWGALGHALGFFILAASSLQASVQAYPH